MMKTKQFTTNDLQIDKGKREILCVASTGDIDRDLEIVLPDALRTKGINYAGRPVLWTHDKTIPAIGSILWLKPQGNQLLCKYRITDKTDFANDIFELVQDNCLQFHSIGFEVFAESSPTPDEMKSNPDWAGARNVIRDFEVLELSICNVPCNANTPVVAKCSPDTLKLLGDDWREKDCWEYEAKGIDSTSVESNKVIEAAKFIMPKPVYARKIDTNRIIEKALAQITAEEILARIRGKA